jgi:hypothetical protein
MGVKKKKLMIVFDHLVRASNTPNMRYFNMGGDGTQDAFYWSNRVNQERKGFFLLVQNVSPYDPSLEGYNPNVIRQQARAEYKRLRRMGVY